MPRTTAAVAVAVLVAGISAACDRQTTPMGPGQVAFVPTAPAVSAQIVPQTLPLVPLGPLPCLSGSPATAGLFSTSFNLVVTANTTSLVLQRVTLQPFGATGAMGSTLVLTPADLLPTATNAVLIPALTSQTFPVTPKFGCGITTPQSLIGQVTAADSAGVVHAATVTAQFR